MPGAPGSRVGVLHAGGVVEDPRCSRGARDQSEHAGRDPGNRAGVPEHADAAGAAGEPLQY